VRGDVFTAVTGASKSAGEIFFVKLFVAADVDAEVLARSLSLLVNSECCSIMVAVLVKVQ
jgi:hypothetical protein